MRVKNRGLERKNKYRNGTILVRLTFSDIRIAPEIIDKISGRISEKEKGLLMINKIIERFDISLKDVNDFVYDVMKKEADFIRNIDRRSSAEKLREEVATPIKWKDKNW